MKHSVDLNCDMGEGFGHWTYGDAPDDELMKVISSANIATGFHAGDPNLMNRVVLLAKEHGVNVGAHPAYRDLQGFGRRTIGPRMKNWSTISCIRSARCANSAAGTGCGYNMSNRMARFTWKQPPTKACRSIWSKRCAPVRPI